jgi:hypothetical protein
MKTRRWMVSAALGAIAMSGCAVGAVGPSVTFSASISAPEDRLAGGDILVALTDRPGSERDGIVRYRRRLDDDGGLRVHAQVLVEAPGRVDSVAGSSTGRWLAAGLEAPRRDGTRTTDRVLVWDLHHARTPLAVTDAVWTSPDGCRSPRFHPEDAFVVFECPSFEREPGHVTPSHLVVLDLPGLRPLALVGERNRTAPAVGVDGGLYWIENRLGVSTIIRRGPDRSAYPVHQSRDPATRVWPQHDGSIVVSVLGPGGERELRRHEASGAVGRVPPPRDLGRALRAREPLSVTPDGDFLFASCTPAPCTVLRAGSSGADAPLSLSGHPSAVAAVPRFGRAVLHLEDLATAPAGVFKTHDASFLSVLGVELGMSLEGAWATLERGGRFPQWIGTESGQEPSGIGVGAVRAGHCVEYLVDDAGLVDTIDLQGCARSYLSPALHPLLDREAMAGGALPLIRRFLGPGVSAQVGDPSAPGAGDSPLAIEGTTVRFAAPERGYSFEARTEILQTSRARLMNGRLRLRLRLPARDARLGVIRGSARGDTTLDQ